MRLMILENRRLRNSLRANGGTVTIGSDSSCNVHLPDPRLGKHQANIMQDDDGVWWLEVLDKSIPTCLNRAVQKSRAQLHHADEIECGSFAIRFFVESERSREEIQHDRIAALSKKHGETLPLGTIILKETESFTASKDQLEQMTLLAIRLSQHQSVGDTLAPILRYVIRQFDARQSWIGIRKRDKGDFDWSLGHSNKGKPCVRPAFSNTVQPRCLDHAQHICVPHLPEGVGSAMAVPLVGQTGTIGLLYVESEDGTEYDEASLNALLTLSSCVTMPIETVMKQTMAVRQAAVATEITIARATQDALTPKALPQWTELQVAAYRHMGTERCCDFYDIVQLRDRKAAIVVGKLHVGLHALPRYFAELRAAFRLASLYGEAPHLFARAMNWILYSGDTANYIDLAVAWVDPATGQVIHCIAGRHVVVGRIHADGTCEISAEKDVPAVGQAKSPAFESKSFELAPGDSLVLATDGANEARNGEGVAFGLEGLAENLCDGLGDTPGHVLNELATDLAEFVDGGANPYDITTVMVRREDG